MANPKCRHCGKTVSRTEAFKVVVSGKNHYYCNEGEYNIVAQKERMRKDLYLHVNDIFGYDVINTVLFKDMNQLIDLYPVRELLSYLISDGQRISSILSSKKFNNEYGKIKYFTAIVKNNIKDFKISESDTVKTVEVDVPNLQHFSRKKKRRGIYEIEEEV